MSTTTPFAYLEWGPSQTPFLGPPNNACNHPSELLWTWCSDSPGACGALQSTHSPRCPLEALAVLSFALKVAQRSFSCLIVLGTLPSRFPWFLTISHPRKSPDKQPRGVTYPSFWPLCTCPLVITLSFFPSTSNSPFLFEDYFSLFSPFTVLKSASVEEHREGLKEPWCFTFHQRERYSTRTWGALVEK